MRLQLPRLQLIELNDQPWVPEVVRDTVVETLSRTLRWGRVLDALVEPFARFLDEAGVQEVLDIGSGAGGPACILGDALQRRGRPTRFILSDLLPRVDTWTALRTARRDWLDFVAAPVDATAIPAAISRGRARLMLNVLHHLPPVPARAVLNDAVAARAPLFVVEGFERNPLRFLPLIAAGLPALLANPLFARRRRWLHAAVVWGSPIAVLVGVWDGVVSTLRIHSLDELHQMVRTAEAYRWSSGRYPFWPHGRGTYFQGVPVAGPGDASELQPAL